MCQREEEEEEEEEALRGPGGLPSVGSGPWLKAGSRKSVEPTEPSGMGQGCRASDARWSTWLGTRRGEPAEGRVRPVGVVLVPPTLDNDLGLEQGPELLDVEQFVAYASVKLSMNGFSHGEPGSM